MTEHQVTVVYDGYNVKGQKLVSDVIVDPPLPENRFLYAARRLNEDGRLVVSGPYVQRQTVSLVVPLETTVFVGDGDLAWVCGDKRPVRKLMVAADALVLRYGGGIRMAATYVDFVPAFSLTIKVLGWRIRYVLGEKHIPDRIMYSYHEFDKYKGYVLKEGVVLPPPNYEEWCRTREHALCEPSPPAPFERFFFAQWLKDRSLSEEAARRMYEDSCLEPYRRRLLQHQDDMRRLREEHAAWMEGLGVIFPTVSELWEYLQEIALPEAAERVSREAQQVLAEAGIDMSA